MRSFVLLVAAWTLAFLGQRAFARWGLAFDGVVLFAGASLAFLKAGGSRAHRVEIRPGAQEEPLSFARKAAIGAGLLLTAVASWLFIRYRWSNWGLGLWLMGIGAFVGALFERREWRNPFRQWWEPLLLSGILAVALFMRTHHLAQMPPALYLDEADNGVWALRFWEKPFSPFTENRDSSATLPYYLLGLALKLGGVDPLTMRLFQAGVGTLTVALFYFLARRFFGIWPAAMGTFLLAVSRWHVNFSRVVFVEILPVPLVEAAIVYCLWRATEEGRRSWWAWAGLLFGLGFHTYIGYRVFPLVVALLLAYELGRRRLRRAGEHLLIFLVATFVMLAPLATFAIKYPRFFTRRMQAASVLNDVRREGSYRPLWDNIRKSLLMFNYRGDPRPRHNLPHEPMLDFWTAMAFGLGLGYSLGNIRRKRYFVLVTWLLVGLLPGIFSLADSNPHSSRTLGNVIPVFLLVAACWEHTINVSAAVWGRAGVKALAVAAPLVLALSGMANYRNYFLKQALDKSVYYDFEPVYTEVGNYIRHRDSCLPLVSPAFTNHGAVKFVAYGREYESLNLNFHIPFIGEPQPLCYVLEPLQGVYIRLLRKLYPGGILEEHRDRYGGLMFYTFEVSALQVEGSRGPLARYYWGRGAVGKPVLVKREPDIFEVWDATPLEPPFTVEWVASLYAPDYGSYQFYIKSSGKVEVYLQRKLLLRIERGEAEAQVTLPAGFHPLRVLYYVDVLPSDGPQGYIELGWRAPGRQREVIPPASLYPPSLTRFGLLGMYYKGVGHWEGEPDFVRVDPFVAPSDVLDAPYSIRWKGYIRISQGGEYVLGTISDDGSLVYIDGKLIVDNGGIHGTRYAEGRVQLSPGLHPVEVLYFQAQGARAMELWWQPPGQPRSIVPPDVLCYYCGNEN